MILNFIDILNREMLTVLFIGVVLLSLGLERQAQIPFGLRFLGIFTAVAFFAGMMFLYKGSTAATLFVSGYLLELSLSVDNILVFLWLFQHFKVPETQQNRILTLGIGGAIVLRLFMIMAGSALLERFDILFIPFGLLLCFAGWQMFRQQEKSSSETKLLRITHYLPIHPEPRFDCFWLQQPNGLRLTTLTVVIILVEAVDVLFAIDSIPAIFSITQDTYIVFTSNILAILGLRSVYHILSKWISKLRYLMPGLGLALMGLGLKMLFLRHIEIPAWILLGFISSIVLFSTLKSLYSR